MKEDNHISISELSKKRILSIEEPVDFTDAMSEFLDK